MADLGREYEKAQRPADAEAVYQRALAIDPDYADLQGRLANLLLQRGAVADAQRHAKEGLRVQPNRRALLEIIEGPTRARQESQR